MLVKLKVILVDVKSIIIIVVIIAKVIIIVNIAILKFILFYTFIQVHIYCCVDTGAVRELNFFLKKEREKRKYIMLSYFYLSIV